jgi:hypothetical protein
MLLCAVALLSFSHSTIALQVQSTDLRQPVADIGSAVAVALLEAIPSLSDIPAIGVDSGSGRRPYHPPRHSIRQPFNKAAKGAKPPRSGTRSWFGRSKSSVSRVQRPPNVNRAGKRSSLLKWWRSNRSNLSRKFTRAAAPRAATRAAQQRGTASISRNLSRKRAAKTPLADARRGSDVSKKFLKAAGGQKGTKAQRSAQQRGVSLLRANKGKVGTKRGHAKSGWLQRWEGVGKPKPGHTMQRHVGKSDLYLQFRLSSNPKLAKASTFPNQRVAERAIARAIRHERAVSRRPSTSQAFRRAADPQPRNNPPNLQAWLRNKKPGTFVIRYTDNKFVGTVLTRDGKRRNTNTVQVVLRMRPNGKYYVETAYPDI